MQNGAVWLSDDKGTHRLRRHSKKLALATQLHDSPLQLISLHHIEHDAFGKQRSSRNVNPSTAGNSARPSY